MTNSEYIPPNHFIKIRIFFFFGDEAASNYLNHCAMIPISFVNPTDAISIMFFLQLIEKKYKYEI